LLYPQFKKTFIRKRLGGLYYYASELPGGRPDDLATLCALYAARAMNDAELLGGLVNSLDKIGGKKIEGEMLVFEKLPSPIWGMILFGKVNIGLEEFIAKKDWTKIASASRSTTRTGTESQP